MKKLKGIGLLELMLALAIISVLLVAATRYFASADSSRKVNDAANMLQAVINASEDVRMSDNSYGKIKDTGSGTGGRGYLQGLGLLPANWSTTSNPWSGDIQVDGTAGTSITLTLKAIPPKDCQSLSDLMVKKGVNPAKCGDLSSTAPVDYVVTYSS